MKTAHFSATMVVALTVTTLKDQPVIWSYALRDGKRRAVVLVNLDTQHARSIRMEFSGLVKGAAHQVQLAADSLTANNELDWNPAKPAVELRERDLANFRNGQSLAPLAALPAAEPAQPPAKPNILIILADDMGYSDLGCMGGDAETPHLNALAKSGILFPKFVCFRQACVKPRWGVG